MKVTVHVEQAAAGVAGADRGCRMRARREFSTVKRMPLQPSRAARSWLAMLLSSVMRDQRVVLV